MGGNEYYPAAAGYLDAVADALHVEYAAIIDAGFTLQIDDPFLTDVFSYGPGSVQEKLETAGRYVDAINRSLRGIPRDRVRLHTCYGINEGPRVHDAPLSDLIDTLFAIEAGAFSFEAANPRHEHVYHVFESVKPPQDTVLLPGVISHATSIVEHPEVIADRIVRFAELVGRENVVASADCGFSPRPLTPRRSTRRSSGPSSRPWPKERAGPPPASGEARRTVSSGRRSRRCRSGTGRRRWWRAPEGRRCGRG